MAKPKSLENRTWWKVLNSNLVILFIATVVFGGVAKLYADYQESQRDIATRRSAYAKLLTEFEHRVADLSSADADLNPVIGRGFEMKGAKRLSDHGADRSRWDRLSEAIGQREWDVLHGRGSYEPTAPEFANRSFAAVAAEMEDIGGVPDIQIGAYRLVGFLDADKSVVWVFVRSAIPNMMQVSASRHLLFADGTIPFPRGHTLTEYEQRRLGFPEVHPGDLDRAMKKANAASAELDNALGNAD